MEGKLVISTTSLEVDPEDIHQPVDTELDAEDHIYHQVDMEASMIKVVVSTTKQHED